MFFAGGVLEEFPGQGQPRRVRVAETDDKRGSKVCRRTRSGASGANGEGGDDPRRLPTFIRKEEERPENRHYSTNPTTISIDKLIVNQ
jgi:hypothetical protein